MHHLPPPAQLRIPMAPQLRSRLALGLGCVTLGCGTLGCVTQPHDREVVANVGAAIPVSGYATNPGETVDVEARNYAAATFAQIAAPVSNAAPTIKVWGTDFYAYSTSVNLGAQHWDRLGNGHEAQIRANVPGYNFVSLRSDWIACLSANLGSVQDFADNCVSENVPRTFIYTAAYPKTVDELLATCPSAEEIAAIDAEITIVVDPVVMADSNEAAMACTPGGTETSARLALYNALRAMKLIRFDEAMPTLGYNNLYEWVRDVGITLRIANQAISTGGGTGINLAWAPMTALNKRAWVDPASGTGLDGLVALIAHEGRHTTPGGGFGHDCDGVRDSSYDAGGAWAVQHDFRTWLSQHSLDYLTVYQQDVAQGNADDIMATRFCSP